MPSEISLRESCQKKRIHVLFLQNDHANHPTEFDARRVRHDRGAQTAAAEAPLRHCSHVFERIKWPGPRRIWRELIWMRPNPVSGLRYRHSLLKLSDTRLTHCFGQPKEGTSSFSSSRTNRSDSNRYGHSSAKFKGGR
ncbi:hypothetical protein MCOR02_007699 [Pyricularia oryzae]|nr:hypothetical protein MCOR02_007699 [Pyricularia oryzae]